MYQKEYDRLKVFVEDDLLAFLPEKCKENETVIEAMAYSLQAGGKRIRPVLLLAACRMAGGRVEDALPFACALEYIHTYSLIHDDLPAMDDDDLRRGKPTNHKVFGEAPAILAGDGLLNAAFEVMLGDISKTAENPAAPATALLGKIKAAEIISRAAGCQGMIGGQIADLESEHWLSAADQFGRRKADAPETLRIDQSEPGKTGQQTARPEFGESGQTECQMDWKSAETEERESILSLQWQIAQLESGESSQTELQQTVQNESGKPVQPRTVDQARCLAGTGDSVRTPYSKNELQTRLSYIHAHKTGALIRAAVTAGACLGAAQPELLTDLDQFGEKLGLAFQIADDILDICGDAEKLGKPVGSDEKHQKLTYPALIGLEESRKLFLQLQEDAVKSIEKYGEKAEFLIFQANLLKNRTC